MGDAVVICRQCGFHFWMLTEGQICPDCGQEYRCVAYRGLHEQREEGASDVQ